MIAKLATALRRIADGLEDFSKTLRSPYTISEIVIPHKWRQLEQAGLKLLLREGDDYRAMNGRFLAHINAWQETSEYPGHFHNAAAKKMMYECVRRRGSLDFPRDTKDYGISGADLVRRLEPEERKTFEEFCISHTL